MLYEYMNKLYSYIYLYKVKEIITKEDFEDYKLSILLI